MNNKKYKISIFSVILILLFNIILFSTNTVIAEQTTQEKLNNRADRALRAKYLTEAFKSCLANEDLVYEKGFWKTDYTTKHAIAGNHGNIFKDDYSSNLGGSIYGAGAYVGTKIKQEITGQDPGNDGHIECQYNGVTNITKLYMEFFLGGSDNINALICDSTAAQDNNYGILKLKGDDSAKKTKCEDTLTDIYSKYEKNPNADAYIQKLYEKWQKKNQFALDYNKVSEPIENKTLSYKNALDVFKLECTLGNGSDYKDKDEEHYYGNDMTFKELDNSGTVVKRHYRLIDDAKKQGQKETSLYKDKWSKYKCVDLVKIINENFETYQKNLNTVKEDISNKSGCGSKEVVAQANSIVTEYGRRLDAHIPLTEEEKNEYDTLSKALKEKNFTVEDGNGGKKCLETRKLKICNTERMKAKAQSILNAYDDKVTNKAQALTDEENKESKFLSEALKKGDFTVDDGNGGKKCYESENFNQYIEGDDSEDQPVDGDNDTSTEEQKQSYCQENGGFLSWMLCPAIADGAATAGGLLGFITNLTTVHTSIIEQFSKQDSSIYKAWSAFRNIANIGFVIMLLVVVFSQVTNIGISNYNIKKILPKLIITAILVNFSYLIMGVLIDLSQIAGNGIEALIKSVAADGMDANASARASATISAIAGAVTGVAGAAVGVAAGTGAIAGLVGGPAIILPVVMFIVTSLISVFFGFIMLSIRQAAIIMVIVLAPLMMVLYALPNTAAITKKYISTVKALLMLYPMFIFATSAGALASSIIIGTSTDLLMMIVGGLLNVLPYFAIPSMTSKSLAGLGAITGAFDKMRGGVLKGASMAGGAIAASEFYKNAKNNFAADREIKRAEDKLLNYNYMRKKGKKLTSGQLRDRARAVEILNKDSKMRAGGDYAASAALNNFSGSGFENLENLARDEAMEYQDKILMSSYRNSGKSEAKLADELRQEMETSYEGATKQEKEAHDSRIRALTRVVGATKSGQKLINGMMADSNLKTSGRAITQLDMASSSIPGFADKHQVLTGQLTSLRGSSRATGEASEELVDGLANQLRAEGTEFALSNINGDKLNAMSNADASELKATGDARFNAALNQLAETGIKNPDIINGLDGAKYEMVHEAQGEIADRMNQTTINVRSTGNEAAVYRAPADFGEIASQRVVNGDVIYTNKNGDTFNASKNQTTKNL